MDGHKIKEAVKKEIDKKMTLVLRGEKVESIIEGLHPISFEAGNKIFYWNPGRVKATLPKE